MNPHIITEEESSKTQALRTVVTSASGWIMKEYLIVSAEAAVFVVSRSRSTHSAPLPTILSPEAQSGTLSN